MDVERIARLTEQQRACLRHVYAHLTSKEIAPLLGIEPGSVDQHIKAAMRILGVADRRAAARILALYEERGELPVPDGISMQEEQMPYQPIRPRLEPLLPLPWEGLRPTHVGWMKRLSWIAAIAIGCALAFGTLIVAAEAFTRLLQD